MIDYLYPGFEEAKVSMIHVSHNGETIKPVSFKLCAILIVLKGSALTKDGVEMPQYSTWFLMPGTELELKRTSE